MMGAALSLNFTGVIPLPQHKWSDLTRSKPSIDEFESALASSWLPFSQSTKQPKFRPNWQVKMADKGDNSAKSDLLPYLSRSLAQ
jgi:hypothetical protein